MLGVTVEGKVGEYFEWPKSKSDLSLFRRESHIELSHVILKGADGQQLQGIGLAFNDDKLGTPFYEPSLYGSLVA